MSELVLPAHADVVTLPSGAWIQRRDPSRITERHRRLVRQTTAGLSAAAMDSLHDPDQDMAALARVATPADMAVLGAANDALAAAVIEAWSYPVPVTVDVIIDLPGTDYDAALAAVVEPRFMQAVFGVNFDPSPVPGSPT